MDFVICLFLPFSLAYGNLLFFAKETNPVAVTALYAMLFRFLGVSSGAIDMNMVLE